MKALLAILVGALLSFLPPAHAQQRTFSQPELDALLAPVALYPDALLSQVLMAATYPADVGEAAAFSRAHPHLKGESAVRAADSYPWDPSVKSLLAFPDVLQRMDESPQWMIDLGQAFLAQEPHVMDTVQQLRQRAYASGHLRSNEHYSVQQSGSAIAVVPVQPHVVYVPYYSPHVVYGHWWWPHHRPVVWRPWRPAPVTLSVGFFFGNVDWHHRHVRVVHRPTFVHRHHTHVVPGKWQHNHDRRRSAVSVQPYHRVPEANRRPIVQSMPPTPHIQTPHIQTPHIQHKREIRREEPRGLQKRHVQNRHNWRSEQSRGHQVNRKENKQKHREARNHGQRGG